MRPAWALSFLVIFVLLAGSSAAQPVEESRARRQAYLDELIELLPGERPHRGMATPLDSTWSDWLERTGELPPNFDEMPSNPFLPDPLVLEEQGQQLAVTTRRQWRQKRSQVARQVKHWVTGTFPPPPGNMQVRVLEEKRGGMGEVTSRLIELRFGPQHRAKMTFELLVPPGEGPFPVFMTQWYHRRWAQVAVRRGYMGVIYAGADGHDDTGAYGDIWYPEYDFTQLMRRAWGAHRVVDYLYAMPGVDTSRIALTGHSRNAKQALWAAAFDTRIDAVALSSGGTGSENPWRYTSPKYDNESIAEITTNFPYWIHPRIRFFVGREHKLPVDQNSLMALVAPRGLMINSAITESQGNPWGIEQAYHSVRRVYDFLEASGKLALRLRHGRHGNSARDIEEIVDFFDAVFERSGVQLPRDLYYNYSFRRWKSMSGENVNPLDYPRRGLDGLLERADGTPITTVGGWEKKKADVQRQVRWSLGQEPAGAANPGPSLQELDRGRGGRGSREHMAQFIGRPEATEQMGYLLAQPYDSFGDYQYGHLYYPRSARGEDGRFTRDLPVVVFLHEYDYSTGFARRSQGFFEDIVDRGYAVFSFDQIGFGTRVPEGQRFYERYPHWSKMGKMVADVGGAVDMLEGLDFIDNDRIYTVGYALGGTLGLFSAALDERIDGAASVSGFTPLRLATADKGVEGVQAFSHLHGLLPRLGFFVGNEQRLPYDFHAVMGAIAPRPLQIIAPELDRDAHLPDVERAVAAARGVYELYGAEENLQFLSPRAFSQFYDARRQDVLDWLDQLNE